MFMLIIRFLPIKCSTERLQQSFSRKGAKTAKKNIFLFLRTWRPLRLCGSPREIPTRPRSSCSPEALFHRSRPVEYLLDRKYIGFAVKLFHRASHRLSDSLSPNSTDNFKYVWLGFPAACRGHITDGVSPVVDIT